VQQHLIYYPLSMLLIISKVKLDAVCLVGAVLAWETTFYREKNEPKGHFPYSCMSVSYHPLKYHKNMNASFVIAIDKLQ